MYIWAYTDKGTIGFCKDGCHIICYVADVLLDYSTDELLLRCERLKECLLKIDDISKTLQTPRGYGIYRYMYRLSKSACRCFVTPTWPCLLATRTCKAISAPNVFTGVYSM